MKIFSSLLKPSFWTVTLLCILFTFAFYLQYEKEYENSCLFTGDRYTYQSCAANFAFGFGLRDGMGYGKPEDAYMFRLPDPPPSYYPPFVERTEKTYLSGFYRTPIYPLFLGTVYSVHGVQPAIAKKYQLLLLITSFTFLPLLGFLCWGTLGFWAGVFPAFLGFGRYQDLAEPILTEPLIFPVIVLNAISFALWSRNKSLIRSAFLALSTALALLTKGSLIFVPIFIFLYLCFQAFRSREAKMWRSLAVYSIVGILCVAPWSIFASMSKGKFVFLSTQGTAALLDGNNEEVADTGRWGPGWRKGHEKYAPTAHFNQPEIMDLSPVEKVVSFYLANPKIIPIIFPKKLWSAFRLFPAFRISILLICIISLGLMIEKFVKHTGTLRVCYGILIIASGYLGYLLYFDKILVHPLVMLLLAAFAIFSGKATLKERFFLPVQPIIAIYFLNFVLLSLILFGYERFVQVIDPLMFLQATFFCFFLLQRFVLITLSQTESGTQKVEPYLRSLQ